MNTNQATVIEGIPETRIANEALPRAAGMSDLSRGLQIRLSREARLRREIKSRGLSGVPKYTEGIMKQLFNPGVDVELNGDQSPFISPMQNQDCTPERPKRKRARKAKRKWAKNPAPVEPVRTVEGFEIRTGIPIPEIKKKQMGRWERVYSALKVGECVVMDKVESTRFQVWASSHGKRISIRTVDGEVLAFKMRKKPQRKQEA